MHCLERPTKHRWGGNTASGEKVGAKAREREREGGGKKVESEQGGVH